MFMLVIVECFMFLILCCSNVLNDGKTYMSRLTNVSGFTPTILSTKHTNMYTQWISSITSLLTFDIYSNLDGFLSYFVYSEYSKNKKKQQQKTQFDCFLYIDVAEPEIVCDSFFPWKHLLSLVWKWAKKRNIRKFIWIEYSRKSI